MPSGVEIYAEYRLTHGSANGTTTDMRPITIGRSLVGALHEALFGIGAVSPKIFGSLLQLHE